MTAYKLVVVQPFGSYQRGDVIYDRKIVDAILDVNDSEMHQLEQNVRRVPLNGDDYAIAFPPVPESIPEPQPQPTPHERAPELHLSSVADDEQPPVEDNNI